MGNFRVPEPATSAEGSRTAGRRWGGDGALPERGVWFDSSTGEKTRVGQSPCPMDWGVGTRTGGLGRVQSRQVKAGRAWLREKEVPSMACVLFDPAQLC